MDDRKQSEGFRFHYSAKEQEELETIRQKYLPPEEDKMQKIEHSQKYPPYHKTIVLPSDGLTINTKIIILESEKSLTMMLNSKY